MDWKIHWQWIDFPEVFSWQEWNFWDGRRLHRFYHVGSCFLPNRYCIILKFSGEERHRSLSRRSGYLWIDEALLWCFRQSHYIAHCYRGRNIFLLLGRLCLQSTHHNLHHHWRSPQKSYYCTCGGLYHCTHWKSAQTCRSCSTGHLTYHGFFHIPPHFCTPGRKWGHNCWVLLPGGCDGGCVYSLTQGCEFTWLYWDACLWIGWSHYPYNKLSSHIWTYRHYRVRWWSCTALGNICGHWKTVC